ncbi:probable xyloglucan galactosyltransferase GT17 [Gastrolobium bilobum]|uniref:probable xyloglucan galactosyltransferase GT17 n=1 Tax=Gastrolobium bilobum TaxID=150636 RepID=UPI002AB1AEF5|nr:probable xyloglucan galactosyltransferase GT17 [Gastrolobium bilobum]
MFFRKPSPTPPWKTKSESFSKSKDTHNNNNHFTFITNNQLRYTLFACLFFASWFLILHFLSPLTTTTTTTPTTTITTLQKNTKTAATCDGSGPFYIYTLPQRFNLGLLKHCQNLNIYTNMCPYVANNGLGQPISAVTTTTTTAWYATHQFIAEMIIHARLENHPCRTWDPNKALLFYIPFYGGLHASSMFREANHTLRDSLAVDLISFIKTQTFFNRHNGNDHFLALGRTAWDFMRKESGPDFGANILLNLPPVKNMSVLTVERQPWNGSNQIGVPYPSYFHPTTVTDMVTWQNKVREAKRPHLFSFVGGKRKGLEKAKIRDEIVKQCGESTQCELVECGGNGNGGSKCYNPMAVLDVMMKSRFCLQAPGDSFTRRSTFDSVLAGCIPVFFSPHTAYMQYAWYLPQEAREYSVYIDEKESGVAGKRIIEDVLMNVSSEEVKRMREVVINLIPRITYAHPNASGGGGDVGFKDAVDVALHGLSLLVRDKIQSSGSAEI